MHKVWVLFPCSKTKYIRISQFKSTTTQKSLSLHTLKSEQTHGKKNTINNKYKQTPYHQLYNPKS